MIDFLRNRRIWIWSASNRGPCVSQLLKSVGCRIVGFIDNSNKLWETYVYDILVWRPEKAFFEMGEDDVILLCCAKKNNQNIKEQLAKEGVKKIVFEWDNNYISKEEIRIKNPCFLENGYEDKCISKCCCAEDFKKTYFKRIANALGWNDVRYHRKIWEFVYIVHVLEEKGLLKAGIKGLGFAVGEEPLPSYFARCGVSVLATDLGINGETATVWANSGQNAAGDINKLFKKDIISKAKFFKNVKYMDLDMNDIPKNIGYYDFCWSSCAIEHVGGLELSKAFLKNMIRVLKPGGVAVHTTEFNLWSNEDTIEEGYSVIYRRKDLEELSEWMWQNGCKMELSFKRTQQDADTYLPLPPYEDTDKRNHLNLIVGNYASTSYVIIITKNIE